METVLSIIFVSLLATFFWLLAGLFADWLTPKIFARRRRRRKGINVNRCPMLECSDRGCVYYDQDCLICRFADRPELLHEEHREVSGNE